MQAFRLYITLDTNIFVSAFGWRMGNSHKIMRAVIDGEIVSAGEFLRTHQK